MGHIAGTVHLSFVADLDFYLDLAAYRAKASKLCKEIKENEFRVNRLNEKSILFLLKEMDEK